MKEEFARQKKEREQGFDALISALEESDAAWIARDEEAKQRQAAEANRTNTKVEEIGGQVIHEVQQLKRQISDIRRQTLVHSSSNGSDASEVNPEEVGYQHP